MSDTTSNEVRSSFLDFFGKNGHAVQPSAPLVPQNDPTLMFVNAGMVPFKDVFTGKDQRSYTRAASSQKCIRISGKHNDLENVGVTARHHTFFEMLGNFSFGDYFKEDAIAFAWELIANVWQVPKSRLVVTVFGGEAGMPADDEAREIWKKVTGFGDDRVIGLGMKDNFWQMGDTGPCGPCTEIHYFHGDGDADVARFGDEPDASGRGWMEIWNLVFMQFERSNENGVFNLEALPKPCVDTGAGLERVTSVLQGKTSNYDTDVLSRLVDKASELAGKRYTQSLADDDVSMRVIADHARTTAFLVAEGIFPDRAGREYVLRRVMRRAIRHGHRLGIKKPFLHEVALEVVSAMGGHYPDLVERKGLIASVVEQEEVRFRETIDRGLELIERNKEWRDEDGARVMPGGTAFKLYDTYGFPLDLTQVIGREQGFSVDEAEYDQALEAQRARSEGSKVGDAALADVWHEVASNLGDRRTVRFSGYDREEGDGEVLALVVGSKVVAGAAEGDEVCVVVDETPFYGESGGQVGDRGTITLDGGTRILVKDTQKPVQGLVVHIGKVASGSVATGDRVRLTVDHDARTATRRNHSATHLLHWALRTVLGEQSTQKGSLVGPEKMRFDFSHGRALTDEEIRAIEDLVNAKILENAPILTEVMPITEARGKGAMAIFEEKYGDVVRVLTMTKDSVELCGGTHARALGDIGLFKIVSEAGVAAGVRRIEAATGMNALAYVRDVESTLKNASRLVKSSKEDLADKIDKLLVRDRQLEKELAETKKRLALGGTTPGSQPGSVDDWVKTARDFAGGKVLAVRIDGADAATLRETAEKLRDKLGDSIVLTGAVNGDKAQVALTVAKSLTDRYKAGELIKPVATELGGAGGGRPDMAQAGGTEVGNLDAAFAAFYARFV